MTKVDHIKVKAGSLGIFMKVLFQNNIFKMKKKN